MTVQVQFSLNIATEAEIFRHLSCCDVDFLPPLSDRVEINAYVQKIAANATRFEAWIADVLVGLVAAYCNNNTSSVAYITSISVLREYQGKGIASGLMQQCIKYVNQQEFEWVELGVDRENASAIKLYKNQKFTISDVNGRIVTMYLKIRKNT